MVFRPSLDVGVPDGFYDLIDGLVGDVYKQASKINRLAAHSGQEHYQVCCLTTFGQSWARSFNAWALDGILVVILPSVKLVVVFNCKCHTFSCH